MPKGFVFGPDGSQAPVAQFESLTSSAMSPKMQRPGCENRAVAALRGVTSLRLRASNVPAIVSHLSEVTQRCTLTYNGAMRGKPTGQSKPGTPQSVAEVLRDHVVLELEGIDRMYLNVYVPVVQAVEGVLKFIRIHRGHPVASTAMLEPITRFAP